MNRCPICNKMVDPKDAEKHARHHVTMGEVGPRTTTKLLTMFLLLGESEEKSDERNGHQ